MRSSSNKILFHIYLFLFGAIYYWIAPLIILEGHLIDGMPGVQLLDNYNYKAFLTSYIIIVVFYILSFIMGARVPLYYKKNRSHTKAKRFNIINPNNIAIISLPFFLIGQLAIFKARSTLFTGYNSGYNIEILGSIATANCVFLILYLILREQRNGLKISGNKMVNRYFLFSLCEFSIILLGFGSRMYVLVPLVSFSIFYLQRNRISGRILGYIGIGIILFLGIGAWRISAYGFDSKVFMYIGCAEPLFTWISAVSYFSYNDIPFLSFPSSFFSSFINFIPTFLFPNKGLYIYPLSGVIDAPLGATNLLTSLLSDFGILGGAIILFIAGFILTVIRYNWQSIFGKAYYCCVCGVIPFQLFRDGFYIVNKMVWFNFLILPLIIIGVIKYLSIISNDEISVTKYRRIKKSTVG